MTEIYVSMGTIFLVLFLFVLGVVFVYHALDVIMSYRMKFKLLRGKKQLFKVINTTDVSESLSLKNKYIITCLKRHSDSSTPLKPEFVMFFSVMLETTGTPMSIEFMSEAFIKYLNAERPKKTELLSKDPSDFFPYLLENYGGEGVEIKNAND